MNFSTNRRQSNEPLYRIFECILREASGAAEIGNVSFLSWAGFDPNLARRIGGLKSGDLFRLARSLNSEAIKIDVDVANISASLGYTVESSSVYRRQLVELVDLGINRGALISLGFDRSLFTQNLKWCRGRPSEVSRNQHKACNAYWNNMHKPEQHSPIDILIETCRFTGVSAAALCRFLGVGERGDRAGKSDAFLYRACDLFWVRAMFPDWDQDLHESLCTTMLVRRKLEPKSKM